MTLVDTSIWVDHLRSGEDHLIALLNQGEVLMHPFILGEIALGGLAQRQLVLGALANLPMAVVAEDIEVLRYIETAALFGLGVGYIDAHLLASMRLTAGGALWTRDRRLRVAAERVGVPQTSLP